MVSHRTILDSLSRHIEALSTAGYRYDSSDAWLRGRTLSPSEEPTRHLEFWVGLGPCQLQGARGLLFSSAVLSVFARATLDDTAASEGILHDAATAAMGVLAEWHLDDAGARTTPRGYRIETDGGEWARIVIDFSLSLTSWR